MFYHYISVLVILLIIGCSQSSQVGVVITNDYAVDTLAFHNFQNITISDSVYTFDSVYIAKYPPLHVVYPLYPHEVVGRGITGTVWLNVLVDSTGGVLKAVCVKTESLTPTGVSGRYWKRSDNNIFNKASLRAIMQWKFNPSIVAGTSARWITVPMRFELYKQ